MDQKNRESAKHLLDWIKKMSWGENDTRTDAVLTFEINPFIGEDGAGDKEKECIAGLTRDDIIWIVDSISCERADVFTIDALSYKYDGDLEEGIIEVEAEIHLSE